MPSPPRRSRTVPKPEIAAVIVLAGAVSIAALVMLLAGMLEAENPRAGAAGGATGETGGVAYDGSARTPIAVVRRRTDLRASPGGARVAAVGPRTEFGSARVLAVVDERPGWLRVMDANLSNGERAWIDERATERGTVDYAMTVDLSAKRLVVAQAGRVIRRIRTGVGERGTPTPTGTFAVTDKVPYTNRASPYGCCALALTAHQPDLPSDWRGGDRIAIHATPVRSSIGRSITLGCMRVATRHARWLMDRIPLGTHVSIRA